MKFTIAFSLISAAAAFAPASLMSTKTSFALNSYEGEIGAINPIGYWDPLGLAENIDETRFKQFRAGEIKNGRVAMLAVLGYIAPETYRFPGELYPGLKFDDIPNGIAAVNVIPGGFWMATFFAIGIVDYLNSDAQGFHEIAPIELDDEKMAERRENEVSNGRLAMLAFFELLRHDCHNLVNPGMDGDHMELIMGLPMIYN